MNFSPVYSPPRLVPVDRFDPDPRAFTEPGRFALAFPVHFDFDRAWDSRPRMPVVWPSYLKLAKAFLAEFARRKHREKIQAFRDLPENWDSYGSGPISELAIHNALAGLEALIKNGLVPENVSATPDESILFEINRDERELILE